MPCRGTGKVISNLGGTPSTVTCPWCDGSGVRIAGIDAQAKWLGDEARRPPRPTSAPQARIVHVSNWPCSAKDHIPGGRCTG